MAAYEQIKKVKLKDPETLGDSAAILYPVTGINAIMAGTSGDNAGIYITGTGSGTQIQPQYLAIITASGYVGDQYLKFIDPVDGKILDNYLKFIVPAASPTETPKISQDYLPSYVDDVVDVPVVVAPDNADPTAYTLEIQVGSIGTVTTYTFYQWNGTQWVQGGGEPSTIYIAANDAGIGDGSIYRCKTGSTTQAIKISENPYAIDTSVTNGVGLVNNNTTISAQAALATNSTPGTVIINTASPTATNNVSLAVSSGTVSVSAAVASPQQAGIVFAVGTMADYETRRSASGDSYLVPTARWTLDMIDSGLAGISYATTSTPGIVQIDPSGNITVNTSGVIAVPNAGMNTAGVVKIVDTIDTTITGNASKAVTQGGIVGYVNSALTSYQRTLSPGSGIDINVSNVISAKIGGEMLDFDSTGNIVGKAATSTTLGGVVVTNDSSFIENGSASLDGKPVAAGPGGISSYVSNYVASAISDLAPIEGGTAIEVEPGSTVTVNLLYDTNVMSVTDNKITVSSATANSLGIAKFPTSSGLVVSNGAVTLQSAGVGQLGGVKTAATNTGISVSAGGQIQAVVAEPLYFSGNAIAVRQATTSSGGVVQILDTAADIDVASKGAAVPVASAIKGYVSSMIAGGTVTVVEGPGIAVDSSLSGSATVYTVGARYLTPLIVSGSALTVQIASAAADGTYGSATRGAVYIRKDVRSTFTEHIADTVPTDSAVRDAINAIPYITYEEMSN